MKANQLPNFPGLEMRELGRKMSRDEVRDRFDAEDAAVYSQRLHGWLPEEGYRTGLMLDLLRAYLSVKRPVLVLDLGAGSGGFTQHVLQAFENSHATLVDFSENMLSQVPTVLAPYPGRYATSKADLFEVDFPDRSFDAVVASFAIHHGRGVQQYGDLYRRIHAWLKPSGIFACCDVVAGDSQELSALNETGWREYLIEKGFSSEQVERLLDHYHWEDSPLSLREHLALIQAAGFGVADVPWKRFNFAIYIGLKKAQPEIRTSTQRLLYS
ncbi:MAG: methyltransferase domain-containing protein [Anaerolineales bacterium]|nr:methyltransferase domain-containing protein [Anaerolineales bacterium]